MACDATQAQPHWSTGRWATPTPRPIEAARNPTFSGSSSLGHPAASTSLPLKVPARFEVEISRHGGKRTARHGQGMGPGGARPRARRAPGGVGDCLPTAFKSHARRRWRLQGPAGPPGGETAAEPRPLADDPAISHAHPQPPYRTSGRCGFGRGKGRQEVAARAAQTRAPHKRRRRFQRAIPSPAIVLPTRRSVAGSGTGVSAT